MPCDPNDNTLNPPVLGPPVNVPGFGLPIVPFTPPFPDVSLPEGIPEDIIALLNELFGHLQWPGGDLSSALDGVARSVLEALASILNQIAPYLSLYNLLTALFNLIMCIIDVLCCLLNPWCTARAVRKLFKRCLPNFLNMLPWLAIIAMIIALLLLLLALIEYIIEVLRRLIEDIIANINALAEAAKFENVDASLAVAAKIARLLCMIEALFALFIALQAIFAVIQALIDWSRLNARSTCVKGNARRGDDGVCCDDNFCPDFVANNRSGLAGTEGQLLYYNQRFIATGGAEFPVRENSIQFADLVPPSFQFKEIITPSPEGFIFWPEATTFDSESTVIRVPYTVDLALLNFDPAEWDNTSGDTGGPRNFEIEDIVVAVKPYIGYNSFDNSRTSTPDTGTFQLLGGKVFEVDEEGTQTAYFIGDHQATIEEFIFKNPAPIIGAFTSDDGYYFNSVDYIWRINHEAMTDYRLISIMCIPGLSDEAVALDVTNQPPDLTDADGNLYQMPNPGTAEPPTGTVGCMTAALAKYRQNISLETTDIFQAEMEACLNDLRDETEAGIGFVVERGTDRFSSTVELDPDVQFVKLPIAVSVQIKDRQGINIGTGLPASVQESTAELVEGQVTFGSISDFTYDGYTTFNAEITSTTPGEGELTVSFNEELFARVLNRENDDVATEIEIVTLPYEFVGVPIAVGTDEALDREKPRRDEGDVAGSGGS
jgi:hypothetical protein